MQSSPPHQSFLKNSKFSEPKADRRLRPHTRTKTKNVLNFSINEVSFRLVGGLRLTDRDNSYGYNWDWCGGKKIVFGIDEVGRGPLAGPVIACAITKIKTQVQRHSEGAGRPKNLTAPAVILSGAKDPTERPFVSLRATIQSDSSPSAQNDKCKVFFNLQFKDSKKLTVKQREVVYNFLKQSPEVYWGVGRVSKKVIEKINILQATKLAMEKAVLALEKKISKKAKLLLIDGNFGINIDRPQKSIIKGDEKIFIISLASIVAKVERDRLMQKMHKKYPQYGFNKHKGYGTKMHLANLAQCGPCEIHRASFKPIHKI